MQSYSELIKQRRINEDGKKIPISDILGKEIIVMGFEMRPSNMRKKDYLCLKFELCGEKRVIFTDSEIIKRECEKFQENMPFSAKIIQKGRYYTFN